MATDVNHIKDNPDFVEEAKELSLYQFNNSPNIQAGIEISAERWKTLYTLLNELATGRLLENAQGVVLDNIGESIGLPRTDADDDQYRVAIQLRAYARNINNDLDSMLDIIARYTGVPVEEISVYKGYFKTYKFQIVTPFLTEEALQEIIRLFPVLASVTFYKKDRSKSLAFISTSRDSSDPNVLGLSTTNPSASEDNVGYLAASVYSTPILED